MPRPIGLNEIMIVNPGLNPGDTLRVSQLVNAREGEVTMGAVKGIREKVHMPLYDSVDLSEQATSSALANRMLRFFVDVQNKTKLETNMQAASVLSHYNTFEAHSLRVVIGAVVGKAVPKGISEAAKGMLGVETIVTNNATTPATITYTPAQLICHEIEPTPQQISDLIFGSVLSLYVGEKVMIEMPTFNFPGGGGVESLGTANHGRPDPMAIFRFAEPVFIERQQSFRVEMVFPNGAPSSLTDRPVRIWTILDGYLTRDVQ